jgi:hypothetical protein
MKEKICGKINDNDQMKDNYKAGGSIGKANQSSLMPLQSFTILK